MINNSNIVCLWYPSGGFGHFVNTILTHHGENFVRPLDTNYQFHQNGNSHNNVLVAPRFVKNDPNYSFNFKNSENFYSVLIDNGINDESTDFCNHFPNASVIKISYSSDSWPIVALTSIYKAMESDLTEEISVDQDAWDTAAHWAQREKYFLFLSQHYLRNRWKPDLSFKNIQVDDLLDYQLLRKTLHNLDIQTTDFFNLWQQWFASNQKYIQPVLYAKEIVKFVKNKQCVDLSHCQDLWTQAVVNYFIWNTFDYIVPANDWADWFTNTGELINLLEKKYVLS
jgi:hypothetical protein